MTQQASRRVFLRGMMGAVIVSRGIRGWAATEQDGTALVQRVDRARTLRLAAASMQVAVATVTSFPAQRSPGGPHDFYSEADYFWPNPTNPSGPYKEVDGRSNPDNFLDHRKAMLAMAMAVPALTAGWVVTKKKAYAQRAVEHLRAWFVTPATRMTPNLEYAQAVRQGVSGRSWGIIDTLHLAEVARAASVLEQAKIMAGDDRAGVTAWFREYLDWLQHSKKGMAERDASNNHAVAWALQAAEFARLVHDEATRRAVRDRYQTVLIAQMSRDGSYPRELKRTKPYGYSIFNFDVMAGLAWSLGGEREICWSTADGRGMCRAAEFLYPYLNDKSSWPYAKDVQHFDAWPVRSPGLLFCGLACRRDEYLNLWERLDPDPKDEEVNRNFPIRQPLLWLL
jgi:hypothetical protein